MFTIQFVTDTVIPDTTVVLRTSVDNWVDRGGALALRLANHLNASSA